MTLGTLFWLVFVVWVIFGLWSGYALTDAAGRPRAIGYHLVVAVLLFLLGWHAFGFVVHG